ncbi:MAG: rod shape-determining protein MreC [Acidobacteriota bacterium]
MARLRLRADLALLVACVGLYIAAASQARTPQGSALSLASHAIVRPLYAVIAAGARLWDSYVVGSRDLAATLAEQTALRREVSELRQNNQLLATELLALRQGAKLLTAFPDLRARAVVARVVARDVRVTHTMYLDRGRLDGVAMDSAVLADRGVIGRVDRVNDHSCRVQLLSHPAAAAAARPVGNDVEGLLVGGDHPALTGLPPYTKVPPDTPVVTTGSEGIYPAGLLLGTAGEAKNAGLFTVVPIQLAARPAEAVVVLVVPPVQSGNKP